MKHKVISLRITYEDIQSCLDIHEIKGGRIKSFTGAISSALHNILIQLREDSKLPQYLDGEAELLVRDFFRELLPGEDVAVKAVRVKHPKKVHPILSQQHTPARPSDVFDPSPGMVQDFMDLPPATRVVDTVQSESSEATREYLEEYEREIEHHVAEIKKQEDDDLLSKILHK
jgi:hypothetical protein